MAGIIGDGIAYLGKTSDSMDLNGILTQSTYLIYARNPNSPSGMGTYGWVTTLPSYGKSYATQLVFDLDCNFYTRVKSSGTWGAWRKVTTTTL